MNKSFKKLCPLAAIVSFALCVFSAIAVLNNAGNKTFEQAVGVFFAGMSVFVLFALFALADSTDAQSTIVAKKRVISKPKENRTTGTGNKPPQKPKESAVKPPETQQEAEAIKRYNGDDANQSGPLTLYIANLSTDTSELDLREEFGVFGTVKSVKLVVDNDTGQSKGYAFVEMSNKTEAELALDDINGQQIKGQQVQVSIARRKNGRSKPRNRK